MLAPLPPREWRHSRAGRRQQASYDFATHPISVPTSETEIDGRSYECINGDNMRVDPAWGRDVGWLYYAGVTAIAR